MGENIPRAGLGDIVLSLELGGEFFLVVVEQGDVGDDDDWEAHPHCVQDSSGAYMPVLDCVCFAGCIGKGSQVPA